MKRFTLSIVAMLMAVATCHAQSDTFPLQFADKDGNLIADGSVLTFTETEEDAFGGVQVPTRLYVKNLTDADVQGGGQYTIETISNGAFQTCFPVNCVQQSRTGSYDTGDGTIKAGELKNMQTEWLPDAAGIATVTYQLQTYKQNAVTKKWNRDQYGPTITLQFAYGTTRIATPAAANAQPAESYTLSGLRTSAGQKGLHIVRQSDGTVRKAVR